MCNLYSMTKGQAAIRTLFKVDRDSAGNLPPMPGIFPDYPAPIVRNTADGRELTLARWGMPSSSKALFDAAKAVFRNLFSAVDERAALYDPHARYEHLASNVEAVVVGSDGCRCAAARGATGSSATSSAPSA